MVAAAGAVPWPQTVVHLLVGLAPQQDRHLAAGAVEVRFDHLEHETGGDGGVEGVAAALQHAHAGGRGEPVGAGDHAEVAGRARAGW